MARVLVNSSQWVKNSPKILDLTKNGVFHLYVCHVRMMKNRVKMLSWSFL